MSEAMSIALVGGIVSLGCAIIPKIMDNSYGIGKDIKDIKKDVAELKANNTQNGDMIYQMLDHLATDNNTGEMKKALDKYNQFYRHN